MMKLIFGIMIFLFAGSTNAQSLQQAWSASYGGAGSETIQKIAADSRNGVYSFGTFTSTTLQVGIFSLSNAGGKDLLLIKHDTSGVLQWAKSFGSSGNDEAVSLTTDRDGNILIAGAFSGTISFGSVTLVSAGGSDIYYVKLDNAGNIIWAKQFGGSLDDTENQTACDNQNNIYICGAYKSTDFSMGSIALNATTGSINVFYAKLNSAGIVQWAKKISYSQPFSLNKFLFLNDKMVLMIGNMEGIGTLNFGPNGSPGMFVTYTAGFMVKLDTAGNFKYQQVIPAPSRSVIGSGILAKNNTLFFAGKYNTLSDFGYKSYILKTDSNVVSKGINQTQGIPITNAQNSSSVGNDILVSNDYRVFVVGHNGGTTDFNNGFSITSPNPSYHSLLIWETDTALVTHNLFYTTPSTAFFATYNSVALDTLTNSLYTGGYFNGAATANFPLRNSLVGQGSDDALITKMSINGYLVVPVKIIDFSGYRKSDKTSFLFWDVAGQLDIESYIIERSTDGISFIKAGTVQANTQNSFHYNFNDEPLNINKVYYRLKIIDKDGHIDYSNIISLPGTQADPVSIYPNPAKNTVVIKLKGTEPFNVQLTDAAGKVLKKFTVTDADYLLDIRTLSSGTYYLVTDYKNAFQFIKE